MNELQKENRDLIIEKVCMNTCTKQSPCPNQCEWKKTIMKLQGVN